MEHSAPSGLLQRASLLRFLRAAAGTGAVALWPIGVGAVCLNPFGCEPKTFDECVVDATKRPTDAGVRMARQLCYDKFVKPEEERQRKATEAAAAAFVARWRDGLSKHSSAVELGKFLGGTPEVSGPSECSPLAGTSPPTAGCFTYRWDDPRPGRVCMKTAYSATLTLDCRFQIETLTDERRTIWAVWEDSF